MGHMLKITTDNQLFVLDYPEDNSISSLQKAVSDKCSCVERVRPMRLYTELGVVDSPHKNKPGTCMCMLIDEDGLFHQEPMNVAGSYLYETDKHGNPIVGNILFVGEMLTEENELTFCPIDDEDGLELLYKLIRLLSAINKTEGANI